MARRVLGRIEGRHGNRRHLRLLGQGAAEGHVVAVEAERAEIRRDEVAAARLQHAEADLAQPRRQPVALRLRPWDGVTVGWNG